MMGKDLEGRVAIVTGGAQGGGYGVARCLAKKGVTVVLADIQEGPGRQALEQLKSEGFSAGLKIMDLSSEDSVKELVSYTVGEFGRIDILASCAGIYPVQDLETMTTRQWQQVVDLNLTAPFWLTRECIPHMKKVGKGRIIYTTTVTGPTVVVAGLAHYGASKAGLEGFMRTAALELAKYQITVNAVAPGAMLTPGLQKLCSPEEINDLGRRIPIGRIGYPEDIGAVYAFLASDEADYITGISIRSDGGYVLPEPVVAATAN